MSRQRPDMSWSATVKSAGEHHIQQMRQRTLPLLTKMRNMTPAELKAGVDHWREVANREAERILQRTQKKARNMTPAEWKAALLKVLMRKLSQNELMAAQLAVLREPEGPKQRKRRARVEADREAIEAETKRLKEAGVRFARGLAEESVARMQGIKVAALGKRRYRKM
jgi:hypothetical protein